MSAFKHGEASQPGRPATREYSAWQAAKARCFNPNHEFAKYYSARGITMCESWRDDYLAFLSDMGRCPTGMSLDRIDVDGPYAPWNCRWVDNHTQRVNRHQATICKRGHVLSGANVYWPPKAVQRVCIECRRIRERSYRVAESMVHANA